MIEIEYTTDIEKDKPAQSSAKERKQDESKTKTDTQQTEVSEATEHDNQVEDQEENTTKDNSSCDLLVDSSTNPKDLKPGDISMVVLNSSILMVKSVKNKEFF